MQFELGVREYLERELSKEAVAECFVGGKVLTMDDAKRIVATIQRGRRALVKGVTKKLG